MKLNGDYNAQLCSSGNKGITDTNHCSRFQHVLLDLQRADGIFSSEALCPMKQKEIEILYLQYGKLQFVSRSEREIGFPLLR